MQPSVSFYVNFFCWFDILTLNVKSDHWFLSQPKLPHINRYQENINQLFETWRKYNYFENRPVVSAW